MNTYIVTCTGAFTGRTRVEASNIHTAIKRAFYRVGPGRSGTNLIIKKGQKVTIVVERV